MIVKRLEPVDLDATVDLFEQYFEEAVVSIPSMKTEWDEESLINSIRNYGIQWAQCWFNAFEHTHNPVGFVAGSITAAPWNAQVLTANIELIYIHPDSRSMENFQTLVDYFTRWAVQAGCVRITAGDIGIDPARTNKIYQHLGFEPACLLVKDIES